MHPTSASCLGEQTISLVHPASTSQETPGHLWHPPLHTHSQADTHTLSLPHPPTAWIMHHQTVGSELMSQLLRGPGETPVRCDGYTKPSPCSGCTQHQMSKVRGDELWVIPLAPLLQCHRIRRQEHVVLPMWFFACVCVSVFGWRTIYMHVLQKGWDHLTLMLFLCRGDISLCSLFCKHLYCRACEENTVVLVI